MSFNRFSLLSSDSISGFPIGALSEVCGTLGSGKTEILLKFLAENPHLRVAWVEEEFSVYPCAFPQRHVALERVFFVDASGSSRKVSSSGTTQGEKLALWVVHQILQSQVFGVVVVSASISERIAAVTLRRLQLLAEKSRCSVILLTESPTRWASWAIQLQLQVERSEAGGEPWVTVLRSKGWRHQIA